MIQLENFSHRGRWGELDERSMVLHERPTKSVPTLIERQGFYDSVLTLNGRKIWGVWSSDAGTTLLINNAVYRLDDIAIQLATGLFFDSFTMSVISSGEKHAIKLPRAYLVDPRYWVDSMLTSVEPRDEWHFAAYLASLSSDR
jgi:hypothetical protein